jgi:hypothetical protein
MVLHLMSTYGVDLLQDVRRPDQLRLLWTGGGRRVEGISKLHGVRLPNMQSATPR